MGTVAKSSITLTSISDAYSTSLAPSVCVIHADFDGNNPVLTNAYTHISVYCGETKIPLTIESVKVSHPSIKHSLLKVDDFTYKLSITALDCSLLEGSVDITVNANSFTTLIGRFLFSIERESTMLDWIQDWEGNKTSIGGSSIITPKLFVGKKIIGNYNSLLEVPELTGVYIGPSENDSCGIYGYKKGTEIFHLDETGGSIGGWNILQEGLYSSNEKLRILSNGSIQSVNDTFNVIWEICADGSASFASGNVKMHADGKAEFKGKIISAEGEIAGWSIKEGLLHCIPIALSSIDKYIAVANITNYPMLEDKWNGNHFSWVREFGGTAMHYTSADNFGLVAYSKKDTQVFSAGATNFIAGWSFDNTSLWIGDKNNNADQYTTEGSLTIGTEGLRGNTWYINTNGTASFVKGLVTFGQTSGVIVGWTLANNKLATDNIALASLSGNSGLYLTANANGKFIERGTDAMENFISTYGGIYLKVKTNSADLGAYDSQGDRLFHITSNGTSYIAGWCFDKTSLWTGTQAPSGFTTSGNITLSPTGLRGYKWRLENDGSGSLAGNNIKWDSQGNVTFGSSVKLSWSQVSDTESITNKLTKIDANGVYTGTISANSITSGIISTASIKCEGKWTLNQDGSGYLASGNITWNNRGIVSIIGGTIGGFNISRDAIGTVDSNSTYMTANHIYSGKAPYGQSPGHNAFIGDAPELGMVMGNLYPAGTFETWGEGTIGSGNVGLLVSVQGSDRISDTKGAFNGNHALYVPHGHITGFRLKTRRVSSSQELSLMDSIIIATRNDIELTLPSSAEDGQIYFIRNWSPGNICIRSSKQNIRAYGDKNMTTDKIHNEVGQTNVIFYDKLNDVWFPAFTNRW